MSRFNFVAFVSAFGLAACCEGGAGGSAWLERREDSAEPCPPHSGWISRPLFDIASGDPMGGGDPTVDPRTDEGGPGKVPLALAPYCLILPSGSPFREALDPPLTESQPVVAPAASVDVAQWQVDRTLAETCLGKSTATLNSPVSLTLVDTAPTADARPLPQLRADGHGEAMARIVDAACTGCSMVDLRYRIGMALDTVDGETQWGPGTGGRFGTIDWLAQAVYRSVLDADPAHPIVLNLSLQFHRDFGDAKTSIDVAALYDALRYARCKGALIITAAGNRNGPGKDDSVPYPAAWSDHSVGGTVGWGCSDVDDAVIPAALAGTLPLVYAAGAVADDDEPIGLSRPGFALTPLVAFGQAAATQLGDEPLSGTSVSSVVVAAAAARRWSELGSATTADAVMADLWASARDLYVSADFGAIDGNTGVRRVGGCDDVVVRAPLPATCTQCATAPPLVDLYEQPYEIPGPPLANYEPELSPSPDTSQCPLCGFSVDPSGRGVLSVTLAKFDPPAVSSIRLAVSAPSAGSGWTTFVLPFAVEPASYSLQVPPDTRRAVLSFQAGQTAVGYAAEIAVAHPQ